LQYPGRKTGVFFLPVFGDEFAAVYFSQFPDEIFEALFCLFLFKRHCFRIGVAFHHICHGKSSQGVFGPRS
jgi:hypothetical protein